LKDFRTGVRFPASPPNANSRSSKKKTFFNVLNTIFDDGASATVGIKKDSTTYQEYSYDTKGKIYSNLTLRFNP